MLNVFAVTSTQQHLQQSSEVPELLSIQLQDQHTLLTLNNGFRVYSQQGDLKYKKELKDGGVGHAQFVHPGIVLLVGGGAVPFAPPANIMFYDIDSNKPIGELLCTNPVRNSKSLFDGKILIIVMESSICIYRNTHDSAKKKCFLPKYVVEKKLETFPNMKGLCCVRALSADSFAILYPSLRGGMITIDQYKLEKELTLIDASLAVKAHENPVACIALSEDGTKFATCSEQGTLVRVFSMTGELLRELRRGSSEAHIYCIAFSSDGLSLCVTSNTPTVHVFSLKEEDKISTWASYFISYEPSIAQFKGLQTPALCYFDPSTSNTIILITSLAEYICLHLKIKGQYEKASEKNLLML